MDTIFRYIRKRFAECIWHAHSVMKYIKIFHIQKFDGPRGYLCSKSVPIVRRHGTQQRWYTVTETLGVATKDTCHAYMPSLSVCRVFFPFECRVLGCAECFVRFMPSVSVVPSVFCMHSVHILVYRLGWCLPSVFCMLSVYKAVC